MGFLRKIFNLKVSELKKRNYICNATKIKSKANGAIAQLVEQRTENPCVAGSNPAGTTKNLKVTDSNKKPEVP